MPDEKIEFKVDVNVGDVKVEAGKIDPSIIAKSIVDAFVKSGILDAIRSATAARIPAPPAATRLRVEHSGEVDVNVSTPPSPPSIVLSETRTVSLDRTGRGVKTRTRRFELSAAEYAEYLRILRATNEQVANIAMAIEKGVVMPGAYFGMPSLGFLTPLIHLVKFIRETGMDILKEERKTLDAAKEKARLEEDTYDVVEAKRLVIKRMFEEGRRPSLLAPVKEFVSKHKWDIILGAISPPLLAIKKIVERTSPREPSPEMPEHMRRMAMEALSPSFEVVKGFASRLLGIAARTPIVGPFMGLYLGFARGIQRGLVALGLPRSLAMIGGHVGAMSALIGMMLTMFPELRQQLSMLLSAVRMLLTPIVTIMRLVLQPVLMFIYYFLALPMYMIMVPLMKTMGEDMGKLAAWMSQVLVKAIPMLFKIGEIIALLYRALAYTIVAFVKGVWEGLKLLWGILSGIWERLPAILKLVISPVIFVLEFIKNHIDDIIRILRSFVDSLRELVGGGIVSNMGSILSSIADV